VDAKASALIVAVCELQFVVVVVVVVVVAFVVDVDDDDDDDVVVIVIVVVLFVGWLVGFYLLTLSQRLAVKRLSVSTA
jgi:hypothetical protein